MRTNEAEHYVGLSLEQATELAKKESRPWRITDEDGQVFFGTCDVVPHRLNFSVSDKVVRAVSLG